MQSGCICVSAAWYYRGCSGISLCGRTHAVQLHETPRQALTGGFHTKCAFSLENGASPTTLTIHLVAYAQQVLPVTSEKALDQSVKDGSVLVSAGLRTAQVWPMLAWVTGEDEAVQRWGLAAV